MSEKVLVFGHAGFTGKHLLTYLKTIQHIDLYGIDRHKTGNCIEYQVDITSYNEVHTILNKLQPKYIINLAGLNYADNPQDLYNANVFPVISILRSLQNNKLFKTKLLIVSSAAVYGNSSILPIKENNLLQPVNFYGTSKLAMEQIVFLFNSQFHISIVRPFNILGPGLPEKMSVPSFIKQLNEIKNGYSENTIKTGNLDPKRDFIDIRDIVKAYWLVMEKGVSGEIYNIGSGKSYSMAYILNQIIDEIGVKVNLTIDKNLVRTNEIMDSFADISKISQLGWKPQLSLNESLKDMVQTT